jgi:D-lactate dehydrogenase (cytochrome)
VPISRLAEAVTETHADLKRLNLYAPLVGHVGDGNFHLFLLIDEADADECQRAAKLLDALVKRAHAMDGTCTGEHGLGKGKRKYMIAEHGKEAVHLMNRLKSLIDPDNLFNPV